MIPREEIEGEIKREKFRLITDTIMFTLLAVIAILLLSAWIYVVIQ